MRIRNKLFLTTAMLGAMTAYSRQAYAACVNAGGTTYLCSGANAAIQSINVNNAAVTTAPGFSINTNGGNALEIAGDGNLSFTDSNDSSITATNGNALHVFLGNNTIGESLVITTSAGSNFKASQRAIYSRSYGSGNVIITSNGDLEGADGINSISGGNDSTVITGAGSTITAKYSGIFAANFGAGDHTVKAYGNIKASQNYGIYATSYGGDMLVLTGANSNIEGFESAIRALNSSGELKVDIGGNLDSTGGYGIFAKNQAGSTNLIITTGVGSKIEGKYEGIRAGNNGSGELRITADGDVTSANYEGIDARNYGTDLTITTGVGSNIVGKNYGISAANFGSGELTITANGDVTGNAYSGISLYAFYSTSKLANVNITNGANISGLIGISAREYNGYSTITKLLLDGTSKAVSVTGTGGTAIQLVGDDDEISITGDVSIDGDIDAGAGSDSVTFDAAELTLSKGSKFVGFEDILLNGISTINGDFDSTGSNITASGGSLHVNGDFTATSLTVDNGTILGGNNTITADLILDNGSTLAPGNSVGTINVVGNVTFNTGSIFEVEVDVGGADRLNATGDIIIQPGVTLELVPLGSFAGSSVTFLDAGGTLTGTFDTINKNGLAADVIYAADNASLNFSVVTASPVATNTQALASLESGALFVDTITDNTSSSAFERDNNYWIKGIYRSTSRDTDGNFNGFDNSIYGMAAGAEYVKGDSWKLGYSIANLENNADIEQGIGDTDGNASFASVHGTYNRSSSKWDMFATLGAMLGYHKYDTSRKVSNVGVTSDAKGDSQAYEAGALLELGARTKVTDDLYIAPKVGLDYIHVFAEGYDEKTGGAAAVSIDNYNFGTLRPSAGVSIYSGDGIGISNMKLRPSANVGVFHEYALTNRQIDGQFSSGTNFRMDLDEKSNTFGTAGVGFDLDITPGVTGFINYQHSNSGDESRNDGRIGIKVEF